MCIAYAVSHIPIDCNQMDFSMKIRYLLFPQNGCYAVTCRALLSNRDHFVHAKQCSFVTFTRLSGLII